jgi:hypothetical protein
MVDDEALEERGQGAVDGVGDGRGTDPRAAGQRERNEEGRAEGAGSDDGPAAGRAPEGPERPEVPDVPDGAGQSPGPGEPDQPERAPDEPEDPAEAAEREAEPPAGTGTDTETDSARPARIDTYVRAQPSGLDLTDRVGRFTGYLALAAFFFGIGTFTDLQHHFSGDPSASARTTVADTLSILCAGATDPGQFPPSTASYAQLAAYDRSVLFRRDTKNYAWDLDTSSLSTGDTGTFLAMRSAYYAASDFLAAATAAARAQDARGYATATGQYREANGLFQSRSADFGLKPGSCTWPVLDAPNVTDPDLAH